MGWGLKSLVGAINPVAALGTVASIGGEIAGDYFAKEAAKDADRTTRAINAENLALSREQMLMQKEFAQHGIRWRAEDAAAAGLHPLAALGASGASYSPVTAMMEAPVEAARAKMDMFRNMGQNLSRAAMAGMTAEEKALTRLRLESADLDNQIKRAELAKITSMPSVPAPVPGQPGTSWQETTYPSVAYMRSPTGVVPIMPPNLAEALESDQSGQAQWVLRYRGGPNIIPRERPSRNFLPPGAVGFVWSHKLQEWQPRTRQELERSGREMAERKHRSFGPSKMNYQHLLP